jgi:hypothetical protein
VFAKSTLNFQFLKLEHQTISQSILNHGTFQMVFAEVMSLVDSTTSFQLILSVPLGVAPPSLDPKLGGLSTM